MSMSKTKAIRTRWGRYHQVSDDAKRPDRWENTILKYLHRWAGYTEIKFQLIGS